MNYPRFALLASVFVFAACSNQSAEPEGSSADEATVQSPERLRELVDGYRLDAFQNPDRLGKADHNDCRPEPDAAGCAQAACDMMNSWDCDQQSEMLAVLSACSGNYGGDCLTTACGLMNSWDCDQLSEIKPIAQSCRGARTGDCLKAACDRMNSWDCDQASEILPILGACEAAHVGGDCVEAVCAQLNSWDCDQWSELEPIIEACGS